MTGDTAKGKSIRVSNRLLPRKSNLAMAQAAAILSFKTLGNRPDERSVYYFVGIDEARFKKPVTAGDQLVLEVTLDRLLRGFYETADWMRNRAG